ncbi:MAG: hypothetical protein U1F17_02095 [Burkholderiaceae bacterium]
MALTEQIQARIAVRVSAGEAPRFDLIRAETEAALARTALAQREAELSAVRAQLRELVAPSMPEAFAVDGDFHGSLSRPRVDWSAPSRSRRIPRSGWPRPSASASLAAAVQRASLMLGVDLFVAREKRSIWTRRGPASARIPLLDRRAGPIEEAQQRLRADAVAEQRGFELSQRLEAWHRYESARATVATLENGVLKQAQVVGVAEAAYRFGERGILEYLDAQRQYRQLRNQLIGVARPSLGRRARRLLDHPDESN